MNKTTQPTEFAPRYLQALLFYLSITVVMLAPLIPHFGTAIVGGSVANVDAWQNIWNVWWVQRALATFQNPFYTTLLYYPQGTPLHLQTLNVTNGILAAPITWLFGPIVGFNTMAILAFGLTGLGGYALALRVAGNRSAALIGGLVLAFAPFHMTKLWDGQLEMIALQWLPLYVLFLLRAVQDGRRIDALLAGLFLALIGYTSWYYFLFAAIFSGLFAVIWIAAPERHQRLATLLQLAIAGLSGIVLLLPILWPALHSVAGGRDDGPPDVFSYLKIIHSADLIDFWLPSALHPLWGGAVTNIGEQIHPYIAAWNIGLGYGALILALLGIVLRRGAAWRWGIIALIAMILSLGPVLQIAGRNTGIALPYALLARVPGVDIAHRPSHFVVITVVLLAPLAALGMAALLAWIPAQRRQLATIVIGALILFELAPPAWPINTFRVNPFYRQLTGGAVIDLPPRLENSAPLQAQIVHGLPMMGGYVSRTPDYPFGRETPIVRELWAMQPGEQTLIPSGPDDALVVLNAYQLQHLIIHWPNLTNEQRNGLEQVLAATLPGLQPTYSDAEMSAYSIPAATLRPFAYFRAGWYGEERGNGQRWRWMGERGEIVVVNPTKQVATVRLRLAAYSHRGQRLVDLSFGDRAAGHWEVAPSKGFINLNLLVPPGEHALWLQAPADPEQASSNRLLSIAVSDATLHTNATLTQHP